MTEIKYLELKQRVESLERESNELFERLERLEARLEREDEELHTSKICWDYVWPLKK